MTGKLERLLHKVGFINFSFSKFEFELVLVLGKKSLFLGNVNKQLLTE